MIDERWGTLWRVGGGLCRVPKYISHQIPRQYNEKRERKLGDVEGGWTEREKTT